MSEDTCERDAEVAHIAAAGIDELRSLWRQRRGADPPTALTRDLMARALTWSLQQKLLGEPARVRKLLAAATSGGDFVGRRVKPGSVIMREHKGVVHEVTVAPEGFIWRGETWPSLSAIAFCITGTRWNGMRFFGLPGPMRPTQSSAKLHEEVTPSAAAPDAAPKARTGKRRSASR